MIVVALHRTLLLSLDDLLVVIGPNLMLRA